MKWNTKPSLSGKYGSEWEQYFKANRGEAVVIDETLYQCDACNELISEPNLALYLRKNNEPPEDGFWASWCDKESYNLVKSYGFFAGENDEIELVFLTKSIGMDTSTKEKVWTYNKNENKIKAAYYIPEKYIKKYNMLESKLIETFPTENELRDIMNEKNLIWKK